MGESYTAICQECEVRFEVNQGPGMSTMPLHCDSCGRERWWEFMEKIPLDDPPDWTCKCGGTFSTDAPPRCPKCRSTNLKRDPDGIEILYD